MQELTGRNLKAWFDSQPERFKTPEDYPNFDGADQDAFGKPTPKDKNTGKSLGNPLPTDGYFPTGQLWNILRHPTGGDTETPTTDLESEFGVQDIDDQSVKAVIDKGLGRA